MPDGRKGAGRHPQGEAVLSPPGGDGERVGHHLADERPVPAVPVGVDRIKRTAVAFLNPRAAIGRR